MALSHRAVVKAYEVFNLLNDEFQIPSIPAWPEDMAHWDDNKKDNPPEKVVLGWDRKSDDGWENLFFFVEQPSKELKNRFDELKVHVPNSSMSTTYDRNDSYWIFGWF